MEDKNKEGAIDNMTEELIKAFSIKYPAVCFKDGKICFNEESTLYGVSISHIAEVLYDLGYGIQNKDTAEELEKTKEELEKVKTALFVVIRNSSVMSKGVELGKSMDEIDDMTVKTINEIYSMIDFNSGTERRIAAEKRVNKGDN